MSCYFLFFVCLCYAALLIYNIILFLQDENDVGSIIHELSGRLQYRITKDAIGKYISFTCTPVRDDGTVGESRTYMGQECVQPGNTLLSFTYIFSIKSRANHK